MLPMVRRSTTFGWEYVVEWSPLGQPKPGLVARTAGAQLDICVPPPADVAAGKVEEQQVSFAYLASYEGMGVAVGSCLGACECEPALVDAHEPGSHHSLNQISQPGLLVRRARRREAQHATSNAAVGAATGCECVARLTVSNETHSGAHKFKVVGLFASSAPMGGYDRGFMHAGLSSIAH